MLRRRRVTGSSAPASASAGADRTGVMRRWVCIVALLAGSRSVAASRRPRPPAVSDRAPRCARRAEASARRGRCAAPPDAPAPIRPASAARGSSSLIAVVAGALLAVARRGRPGRPTPRRRPDSVRILTGAATTLDPGRPGRHRQRRDLRPAVRDAHRLRPELQRPAGPRRVVASSTTAARRIVFHLRPDLTFSDGSPLRPSDVVRSWLRLIDPAAPSPLASLMLDVDGAPSTCAGGRDAIRLGRACAPRRDRRRRGRPGPPGDGLRRTIVAEPDVRGRAARRRRRTRRLARRRRLRRQRRLRPDRRVRRRA